MKINLLKEDLEKAVSFTEKITGKNLSLPVLKGILINVDKKITLSSTNLDLGIEIEVDGKIEREGRVVVDGMVLYSFLSNLQRNDNLTIELKDKKLLILGKGVTANISILLDDDFPIIPKPKKDRATKIKANLLVSGLKSVWVSASNSNIKPELSSVYLYCNGEKLIFVATDSFRLSEKTVIVDNIDSFEPILIPIKNINEIIRNIEFLTEDIDIYFEDNQVSFICPKKILISRIIDGNFPDYKQIIPKEFNTEVVMLKEDIINALKLTNVFADKFNQIIFNILPSKKNFSIRSQNQERGENTSVLEATLSGDDIEIGFNYKYIIEAFNSILSDSISISLVGPGKPILIKGVSDNSFNYIVMPMNR